MTITLNHAGTDAADQVRKDAWWAAFAEELAELSRIATKELGETANLELTITPGPFKISGQGLYPINVKLDNAGVPLQRPNTIARQLGHFFRRPDQQLLYKKETYLNTYIGHVTGNYPYKTFRRDLPPLPFIGNNWRQGEPQYTIEQILEPPTALEMAIDPVRAGRVIKLQTRYNNLEAEAATRRREEALEQAAFIENPCMDTMDMDTLQPYPLGRTCMQAGVEAIERWRFGRSDAEPQIVKFRVWLCDRHLAFHNEQEAEQRAEAAAS